MSRQLTAMAGALAILAGAWLSMGTGEAQTPSLLEPPFTSETSSITVTLPELEYRLHVVTGSPGQTVGSAPDGTVVQVSVLPDPRLPPTGPSGICGVATVRGGTAEVTVVISDACPDGADVGITLFVPGQVPITATSEPPIEWRHARSDGPPVMDSVVRPVPPHTAGEGGSGTAPIAGPGTGSGGLCC